MKHVFLTILYAAVLILSSSGCDKSYTPAAMEVLPIDMTLINEDLSLQEIKDLNEGHLNITYFPDAGNIPKEINGLFSTRKIFTAEDALYALLSVRTIMRIEDASFACTKEDDSGEYKRFDFVQMYKGLPVFNGGFTVYATKEEGEPVSVSGFYMSGLNLDVNPEITEKEARKAVKTEGRTKITESRLVVYGTYGKSEPESCLAYKFVVSGKDMINSKEVYVNAVTGNIIAEYPLVMS